MTEFKENPFEGQVLDEHAEITIVELCRICSVETSMVERLVDEGVLEPVRQEEELAVFPQSCVRRTRVVMNLRTDLGVNLAGAALALELLDRIEHLKSQLRSQRVVTSSAIRFPGPGD